MQGALTSTPSKQTYYLTHFFRRRPLQITFFLLFLWLSLWYMGVASKLVFQKTQAKDPDKITQTFKLQTVGIGGGEVLATQESNTSEICNIREIDPFDSSIEKYLERHSPLDCSDQVPNVVRFHDNKIIIDLTKVKEALRKTKSKGQLGFCQYKVLRRSLNDREADVIATSARFNSTIEVKKSEEDIRVECYDTEDKVISRSYFSIVRVDPRKQGNHDALYKSHVKRSSPSETLSILMLGLDALSKQHFARAMPNTRDYLVRELGGLEMNKHNKLAYSTFPNVAPLLSGQTLEELETDPRWKFNRRGRMDQINEALIWSEAKRLGYRSALMLDLVGGTAFHYLRQGFKQAPVDHYMRAIVVDSNGDSLMRKDQNCYGDEPEVSKLYDYWLQLVHHYNSTRSNQTPFFAYSFINRLTHDDYNMAFAADHLHLKFLQDLKVTNALNNTVIILFSDHGERYGRLRHTPTGEVETNTPVLFFVFPPWFERKYPEVMRVFKTNQNRLTSFFDVHATMKDILYFKGVVGPQGRRGERAISFFREIPLYRTCEDAQIPVEYCACLNLTTAKIQPRQKRILGEVLTAKVMSLLKGKMSVCAKLTLKSVERVMEQTSDKPGFRLFRVNIKTTPGDAQFQARMTFNTRSQRAEVVGRVARINMYRGQADCMDIAELRNYCYCKNLLIRKPT